MDRLTEDKERERKRDCWIKKKGKTEREKKTVSLKI